MALTSRTHGVTGRIRTATSNLHEDNQSLISDIGKAFSLMKEIAVDFERAKQFERVKELENAVELVDTYEDRSHFSSAIESVGVIYQPGPELTDFDKLFKNEVAQLKANSSSVPQNHPLMREFREAVWLDNAKSKHNGLVNVASYSVFCNKLCLEFLMTVNLQKSRDLWGNNTRCPVAACPAKLQLDKVKHDPLLAAEIDDLRKIQNQSVMTDVMDVTEFEE